MSRAPCHWQNVAQMPRGPARLRFARRCRAGRRVAGSSCRPGPEHRPPRPHPVHARAPQSAQVRAPTWRANDRFWPVHWRDRLAESRSQFSQPATSTLKKRTIVVDAKGCQDAPIRFVRPTRSESSSVRSRTDRRASSSASSGIGPSNTRGAPRGAKQAKYAGAARHRCHPISLGAGADPPARSKAGRHGPRRLASRATSPARTLTIQPRR